MRPDSRTSNDCGALAQLQRPTSHTPSVRCTRIKAETTDTNKVPLADNYTGGTQSPTSPTICCTIARPPHETAGVFSASSSFPTGHGDVLTYRTSITNCASAENLRADHCLLKSQSNKCWKKGQSFHLFPTVQRTISACKAYCDESIRDTVRFNRSLHSPAPS